MGRDQYKKISLLRPNQEGLQAQQSQAAMGKNAGGAFGNAADYYYDLLSNDSNTFNKFAAPEMRRFNEDIIPGLSEQFAGMGAGGLSSSGFRNAAVGAGTDLSERLGALRAQLRQQGAQGLQNLGQGALSTYDENVYEQPKPGFLESLAPAAGGLAGSFLGPIGAAAGQGIGSMFGNWFNSKGQSSPYGNSMGGQTMQKLRF